MNNSIKKLFIGVGNPLRKDDGVGPFIVKALKTHFSQGARRTNCRFIESSGEGSRLMDSWRGFDEVIIFDALMKQGRAGTIVKLDAALQTLPSDYFKYSSHAFSLAEAVEMARILEVLPNSLLVYGIEGEDFGFGEGLSSAVRDAATRIIETFL